MTSSSSIFYLLYSARPPTTKPGIDRQQPSLSLSATLDLDVITRNSTSILCLKLKLKRVVLLTAQQFRRLLEHEMILERVRYLEVRRSQDTRER